MKKISLLATFVLVLALILTGSVGAAIVEVPNPGDQYWDSTAQAIAVITKNGDSQGSGKLASTVAMGVTDLSNSSNITVSFNKPWTYTATYHFTFQYDVPTADAKFTIYDQNNNFFGFVDQPYFGFSGFPDYRNKVFYTIRLNYAGSNDPLANATVNISELTLNGNTMGVGTGNGTYNSGFSNNFVYFANSDGSPFTNFTIAGDFIFTNGVDANTPRFEFDLGGPAGVPLPPAVLLLGTGLLGLVGLRRFRKG